MQLKSEMRLTTTAIWMIVAVSCAALPVLHAIPALTRGSSADFMPLLLAILIGLVTGVASSAVMRRLFGAEPASGGVWASFTPGAAAAFGVVGWGLPLGLLLTLDNFLRSRSFYVLASNVVIWALAGIAFGLLMRWTAQRGEKKSQA